VLEVVSDRKLGQLNTTYELASGGAYIFNSQANEYIYVGTSGTHDIEVSPVTEDRIFDVYLPEVMSYSDYYPFLMKMEGPRSNNAVGYRYQGQGQEEDNEMTEGMLSFEYRVHDPRIGRFLSVDPLSSKYPFNSPYAFAENSPIAFIDLEGLERYYAADGAYKGKVGESDEIRVLNNVDDWTVFNKPEFGGLLVFRSKLYTESSSVTQEKIAKNILNNDLGLSKTLTNNVEVSVTKMNVVASAACYCDGEGKDLSHEGNPTITLNAEMKIYDNYYNLATMIFKESQHLNDKTDKDKYGDTGADFLAHNKVMDSEVYEKSTDDFKQNVFLKSAGTFLWNYYRDFLNQGKSKDQDMYNSNVDFYREHGVVFDYTVPLRNYEWAGGDNTQAKTSGSGVEVIIIDK